MSDLMEWVLILLVLYIFASVWLITTMLEKILKIVEEIVQEK